MTWMYGEPRSVRHDLTSAFGKTATIRVEGQQPLRGRVKAIVGDGVIIANVDGEHQIPIDLIQKVFDAE